MSNKPYTLVLFLIVALAATAWPVAAAGGTRQRDPMAEDEEAEKTPEVLAIEHYNMGLSMRDRAWKLEAKAAATEDPAKREKLESKALRQYRSAIREFEQCTRHDPDHYQAYSSLGYASRKVGEFDQALVAYDRALDLNPGYTEAIEYRAEAYLGLNRIEEAKKAYMELFAVDRPRADELLAAMKRWVEQRKADPGDVDGETIDAFAAWVAERDELAGQTAQLTESASRQW